MQKIFFALLSVLMLSSQALGSDLETRIQAMEETLKKQQKTIEEQQKTIGELKEQINNQIAAEKPKAPAAAAGKAVPEKEKTETTAAAEKTAPSGEMQTASTRAEGEGGSGGRSADEDFPRHIQSRHRARG